MTLTEIQKNFTVWRENRRHSKEKIPNELWQQVASVYSSYPPSIICRRLGLSSQALKIAMQGDGFASFMTEQPLAAVQEEVPVCELILERAGTRLIIKVPMSAFDLTLSKLVGHMPC